MTRSKEDATPVLQRELAKLCEAFLFRDVLAALDDPETGGALAKPASKLLRGRALAGLGRFQKAYALFTEVRREREISAILRVEAQLRSARILRYASPLVDTALELSLAAADRGERLGDRGKAVALEARVEAALLYARKRCKARSEAQIERGRTLGLEPAAIGAGAAEVALAFDDRLTAKNAFSTAAASIEPATRRLGHLGLIRVHTLLGEFAAAELEFGKLTPLAPLDIGALRLRQRLLAAMGSWTEAAAVLRQIAEAAPEADAVRQTLNDLATALYRAGNHDAARATWARLASGDDSYAARARRMLEKTNSRGGVVQRLTAFPSVSQLRDHCGPAAVELYLRFFGIGADQVDVARQIKHPDGGTPVYRMRGYMQSAGFTTRRIEADLPKLKAILDAGAPVILEEDYSATRHVAVAVGYDDARELLEVQDPMTHEVRETFYEDLPKLREFSNHGALIALPKDRTDLLARLDDIGAVECDYMTKTDLAWKALDDGRYDDADRLVDEAIALHEPYELAWVLKFNRARGCFVAERSDENRERLIAVLDRILVLWPDDEWPQQFLGQVYDLEDRPDDALEAFERARDRDPDDANNYSEIGDCLLALGRRDDARKALEQALERDPAHVRANENLAALLGDAGELGLAEILNGCAIELNPGNPFNHHVRSQCLAKRGEPGAAVEAYDRALDLAPNNPYYVIHRARLRAKAGAADEALAELRVLCDERPEDTSALAQWADIAYEQDRTAEALEACARLARLEPENPAAQAIEGASRCKGSDFSAGVATLKRALAAAPTYAWAYRELGRHLAAAGRHDEAVAAYAAHAGVAPSAPASFLLGKALAGAGHVGEAVEYMRRAAPSGELSEGELAELAAALTMVSSPAQAHSYFENLTAQRPNDPAVILAHVRLLVERLWVPGAAAIPIAKLSEIRPEHPFVLAKEGDDLMEASLELEPRGEDLLRRAIARSPDLVYPRRSLARQLGARGRFDETLALLEAIRQDEETAEDRIKALVGLGRETEARRAAAEYAATLPEELRDAAHRRLLFHLAHGTRRFDEALELAEAVSLEAGELPDDGELSPWERKRFECLVALGRSDEAFEFGDAQCRSAEDRGDLAYLAITHDDYALAIRFATLALAEDPNEASSLHVRAKQAEMEDDVPHALELWERMQAITGWHIHVENIARVRLGLGDLERAREAADRAVATGHVCPVALQVRAEVRLVSADRAGAKADAERAFGCTQLHWRSRAEDTLGLQAGLAGDAQRARKLYETFLAREKLSKNSRLRLSKVMEALGL